MEDIALGTAIAVNTNGEIKNLVTLSEINIKSALKMAKGIASAFSPLETDLRAL